MFKKGTKLFSIFKNKCPKCHNGDFFTNPVTFNPKKVIKIHKNCPSCNLKYVIEPSFFFGAMYINYGLAVAIFVITFIISKVIFNQTFINSFIAIIVVSLLLSPIVLRLSRIIWINIFVAYDKDAVIKKND
ncbi:DUF983 domain-containing protein [uncultured Polaribacter sp.]|uniref:DUF983 domain-containing protein n=1 Tax=uncultured Polaribacter sp. TaxID=174711 RepID=UPI0026361E28|nr:DUF983 domain-containing protein [uncultured Polaribacter sp.]